MTFLTEYFMRNHRVTSMIVFLIFLAGILSTMTLQREEFPAISYDIITVTTVYPGAAPEDVEINVTNRIEDQLMEVENIRRLTSMSMENLSVVTVQIDSDTGDAAKIATDVRDAVLRVTDLPDAVTEKPVIQELSTSQFPVIELAISGDVPELALRTHARELESLIREVPGVSGIEKIGYRKREIKIRVDPEKMKRELISFNEIMKAIEARNVRTTGGTIESYVSEKKIITLSEYDRPMDVRNVIIRSNYEGYSTRLTDVAGISNGFERPQVLYRGNGSDAIGFIITKQDGADSITLSDSIHDVIDKYNKTLPENVNITEIYDYSAMTRIMLNIVQKNGIFGFLLVIIVMMLFLDWKSAFWSAFGIPFSILGALILFAPLGINLNMVSLSALILILGIIVDDAIVVTEKIYTLKQTGMDNDRATIEGVRAMILPVSAAVITTVLAFLPILFIPGIMGRFMSQIPIIVTVTLAFSLVEVILFIPAHIHRATPPKGEPRRTRWIMRVREWYHGTITTGLRRRNIVITGYAVLFAITMLIAGLFLEFMLDEDIDPDFFSVVIETPSGTSLARTAYMVKDVEEIVSVTVPDKAMKSFTTGIGHHNTITIGSEGGQYSNWAMISVYLEPAEQRDITSEEIIARLRPKLAALKKQKGFERLDAELIAGLDVGRDVEVTWISDSDMDRERFEKETVSFLRGIKGVSSVESDNIRGKNELRLKLDHAKLARMGLTALDVARTVHTAFDGTVVTSIRRNGEDIDYRVGIKDPHRYRAAGILGLPVANREGRLVELRHFARLDESPGPAVLRHYRGKRSVTVRADVDQDVITPVRVNSMIQERFEKEAAAVPGLRMKMGGQQEEMALSMRGFYFAGLMVIIAIYFILVVLFNSYLQPALIMSIIPFAAMGVCLTLIIHGRPLIFISLVGMLGLIGVVVNDTIVMITHLNSACRKNGNSLESIARGAAERFRPVVLTTLTTFAGLMPTAYGIGGDLPTIRPLVLTMAWGLVFSTIITLGFIPILFSYVRVKKGDLPGPDIEVTPARG